MPTRRANTSFHRLVWSFTAVLVLMAIAIVGLRANGSRRLSTEQQALVDRMLTLLEADPHARLPESRASVDAVAALSVNEGIDTAETQYARGVQALGIQDFAAAETAFRASMNLKPKWSWPHNGLGIALYRTNRWDEAEAQFRKAIELDPDWSRPYNDLAILLRLSRRFDEAEQAALAALERDPDGLATNNNYGNLLVELRRFDEAEDRYERAKEIAPEEAAPYYNLACLASLRGDPETAVQHLAHAIEINPVFRIAAQQDADFDPIRTNPEFEALIRTPSSR